MKDTTYFQYASPAAIAAGMLSAILVAKYVEVSNTVGLASAVAAAASIALLALFGRSWRVISVGLIYVFVLALTMLGVWLKVTL